MSKLIIKDLEFCNWLTYSGEPQHIDFTRNIVSQISGDNGAGKSTIPLIIEETIFNKNSRGLAKSSILSWNADPKDGYYSKLIFSLNNNEYTITKHVKSTSKVTLLENGIDISGHTTTQTYKILENILGCDFISFTKLIYQSPNSNMDFLKATDAKRKEFLVSLFDQEIYKQKETKLKELSKIVKEDIVIKTAKLETILSRKELLISKIKDFIPVIDTPSNDHIVDLKIKKAELVSKSLEVNKIKKEIESYDLEVIKYTKACKVYSKCMDELTRELGEKETLLEQYEFKSTGQYNELLKKYNSTVSDFKILEFKLKESEKRLASYTNEINNDICHYCGSVIDISKAKELEVEEKNTLDKLYSERDVLKAGLEKLDENQRLIRQCTTLEDEIVNLKNPIAPKMPENMEYTIIDFSASIDSIEKSILEETNKYNIALKAREDAISHNSNQESIRKELEDIEYNIVPLKNEIIKLHVKDSEYNVLLKVFGSKGLVAYKLEYYLKTFESAINSYLSSLTDGKFILNFLMDGSKLSVIIYNNGNKTTIENCSLGQQARINIATLLAIRKLMSSISKLSVNINFLDEIISYITEEGVNTLIDILLEERDTNSFIISHKYTHPLVPQISVEYDGTSSYLRNSWSWQ